MSDLVMWRGLELSILAIPAILAILFYLVWLLGALLGSVLATSL
jgi:hypothetical protein